MESLTAQPFTVPRACTACAKKKVRCDKALPCSTCRTAGLQCVPSTPNELPARQRIHVSDQFERRLESMETQLGRIEELLRSQCLDRSLIDRSHEDKGGSPIKGLTKDSEHGPSFEDGPAFEGATSLGTHSQQARATFESLLEASPNVRGDINVITAMKNLEQAMHRYARMWNGRAGRRDRNHHAVLIQTELGGLPSVGEVTRLVHRANEEGIRALFMWSTVLDAEHLISLCIKVYEDESKASPSALVLGYGLLHYICVDMNDPLCSILQPYFAAKLDVALSNLPILLPVSEEAVIAALFGAGHSIETGEFERAWALVSTAARGALRLGWHQRPRKSADSAAQNRRQTAFWAVYLFDKFLSFRLGCASNIQDYDVVVELPPVSADPAFVAWNELFHVAIRLAAMHGLIYEKVYSSVSMALAPQERAAAVPELVSRLRSLSMQLQQINYTGAWEGERLKGHLVGCDVIVGSLLTMMQRIFPLAEGSLGPFTDDCLASARNAMRLHQHNTPTMRRLNQGTASSYITWTLLNSPFTPVHVVFCNAVLTLNPDDLALLQGLKESLREEDHVRVPSAVDAFTQVCTAFCDLANHYIAAVLRDGSSSSLDGGSAKHTPVAQDAWASSVLFSIQPSFDVTGFNESSMFSQLCDEWLAGNSELDQMDLDWRALSTL